MNEATTTRHSTVPEKGVKGPMELLLKGRAEEQDAAKQPRTGLTLGELGSALGIDKTRHGELAAALNKSRSEGKVKFETGPRTGNLGPRFVKRYLWAKRTAPAPTPEPVDAELRRALARG
jgi:hypothetical protein